MIEAHAFYKEIKIFQEKLTQFILIFSQINLFKVKIFEKHQLIFMKNSKFKNIKFNENFMDFKIIYLKILGLRK